MEAATRENIDALGILTGASVEKVEPSLGLVAPKFARIVRGGRTKVITQA